MLLRLLVILIGLVASVGIGGMFIGIILTKSLPSISKWRQAA